MVKTVNQQLWHRHHSLYDRHLLTLLPAEVAFFKVDEEGAKIGAADEGASGKDQGDETNRPALEGVAGRTATVDEGMQSARGLFATPDSDALSVCTLSSYYDLAGFSPGDVFMATRSFSRRSLPHFGSHDGRYDDHVAANYAGPFS